MQLPKSDYPTTQKKKKKKVQPGKTPFVRTAETLQLFMPEKHFVRTAEKNISKIIPETFFFFFFLFFFFNGTAAIKSSDFFVGHNTFHYPPLRTATRFKIIFTTSQYLAHYIKPRISHIQIPISVLKNSESLQVKPPNNIASSLCPPPPIQATK